MTDSYNQESINLTSDATTSSGQLLWGNGNVAATTTTRYLEPGYDASQAPPAPVQINAVRDGVIRNLFIRQNSPAGNGSPIVYTLRVNGVPTGLTVTVNSDVVAGSNLSVEVGVLQGDLLDIEVTKAGSVGSSPSDIVATAEFA